MRRYLIAMFVGLTVGLILAVLNSYLVASSWYEREGDNLGTIPHQFHAPDSEWSKSEEWNRAADHALSAGLNLVMLRNLVLEDGPTIVIPSCMIAVFVVYLRDRRKAGRGGKS